MNPGVTFGPRMISANERESATEVRSEKPQKSRENAESRERWLSACGANLWVAVFEEKSFSSPRGTLFVTILSLVNSVSACRDESCRVRVPFGGFQIGTGYELDCCRTSRCIPNRLVLLPRRVEKTAYRQGESCRLASCWWGTRRISSSPTPSGACPPPRRRRPSAFPCGRTNGCGHSPGPGSARESRAPAGTTTRRETKSVAWLGRK